MLDVDFQPSTGMHSFLKANLGDYHRQIRAQFDDERPIAFVVPAFEVFNERQGIPKEKEELRKLALETTAIPVHWFK